MKKDEIRLFLKKIKREHVLSAFVELDKDINNTQTLIRQYVIRNEDKTYPPPETLRIAFELATGEMLPDGFFANIGEGSEQFKFIRENGFELNSIEGRSKFYLKRLLENELGYRKGIPTTGETFMISKDAAWNFFPPLGSITKNDSRKLLFSEKDSENYHSVTYTFHNDKYFDGTRNEFRIYLTIELLSNFRKFVPDDLVLISSTSKGLNEFEILHFKKGDAEYEFYNHLLGNDNHLLTNIINESKKLKMSNTIDQVPLNQILFGPPGTGKTYNTILKTLKILGVDYTDYRDATEKFQQEIGNRIEFVSMHQSFSYEDFVQGLRPKSVNGSIQFEYVDGVFRKICTRASEALTGDRSEVFDSQISNYEIAEIAFYLAKFNGKRKDQKLGVNLLGYRSDDEAFRFIGDKIGVKPNSLKNHRDKFDFILKDRPGYTSRKGWLPRNGKEELDNTSLWPYNDIYNELDTLEINQLSDRVISILKKFEIPAISNPDGGNFVIVLDEINRANISKVFGELITLIEEDKRETFTVRLPSGDLFSVPPNLFIIGTMNTADKSVSMVDIALRRRFEFEAMYPDYKLVSDPSKKQFMFDLNREIIDKKGIDFQIGHSEFMRSSNLLDIINKKIIPLLMEYFRNRNEEVIELLSKCLPKDMEVDSELLRNKLVKVNIKS